MKTPRHAPSTRPGPSAELTACRVSLAESEATLRAIRTGEVDTLMVAGKQGVQVFTLQGAEHAYRVLIESMNEGALTLAPDKTILYANRCFARMVKCPLEQIIGGSLRRFLTPADRAIFRPLLKRYHPAGSKVHVMLVAADRSRLPAQLSIRAAGRDGINRATTAVVVTDLTESRHSEEMLQALSRRLVEAQEAERGRVALELHDNITQLLCGILVRAQTLADQLPAREGTAKREAVTLRTMLGEAAEEVERIARDLRPSQLEHLGLAATLRDMCQEFAERTGVALKLHCAVLTARLPADIELTLYRILQEALKNVDKHASARRVTIALTKPRGFVQLQIGDDGIGFDAQQLSAKSQSPGGLGILSMRERAAYVGGTFQADSTDRHGVQIKIRIPLPPHAANINAKKL